MLESFAPLDAVGAENYIRYGVSGPKRYITGSPESIPTPEEITVQLEIADVLTIDDFVLTRIDHIPLQYTVWLGYRKNIHLIWVWDFYRMISYIRINLKEEKQARAASQKELVIRVGSDLIDQRHKFDQGETNP